MIKRSIGQIEHDLLSGRQFLQVAGMRGPHNLAESPIVEAQDTHQLLSDSDCKLCLSKVKPQLFGYEFGLLLVVE